MLVACMMMRGARPALAEDLGPPHPPGQSAQVYSDPLAPFNEKMFWLNLKLDHYFLHPVAEGYAFVAPTPVREAVGHFLDNVNFIPRFANNLFQLQLVFILLRIQFLHFQFFRFHIPDTIYTPAHKQPGQ